MTSASGRMAFSVRAVSSSVSPFCTELRSTDKEIADAPSRCAAVAKDIAVRVEVAGEGADRLGARGIAAVHVQRKPGDEPDDVLAPDECAEPFKVPGELRPADGLGGTGEVPAGIANGETDGLGADVEPGQFA